MNFENFDINMLKVLVKSLDSGIETGPNILGMSDLPFCSRAIIIKKIHDLNVFLNNKMLRGMLYETVLYMPHILKRFLYNLHRIADIQEKLTIIDTKKQDLEEIKPGKKLRFTPDIYTNLYSVEVKTTTVWVRNFEREIAPYYSIQLNGYVCKYQQEYGFVHCLNWRVWDAKINEDDFYWDTLWQKYGYFLPQKADYKAYKQTKEYAIWLFEQIDNENLEGITGPTYVWECGSCDPAIKSRCPNPMIRKKLDYYQDCDRCGSKIEKGDMALFRNEHVFCTECFDYVKMLLPDQKVEVLEK